MMVIDGDHRGVVNRYVYGAALTERPQRTHIPNSKYDPGTLFLKANYYAGRATTAARDQRASVGLGAVVHS